MIDFMPLFTIAFLYLLAGIRMGEKKKKNNSPVQPIVFTTNLQEMIDTDLYVADINKFTAKINSIIMIDKIGFSQNGKFYYTNKKI